MASILFGDLLRGVNKVLFPLVVVVFVNLSLRERNMDRGGEQKQHKDRVTCRGDPFGK